MPDERPDDRSEATDAPRQNRLSSDVFVALDVPRHTTRSDYDVDRLGLNPRTERWDAGTSVGLSRS